MSEKLSDKTTQEKGSSLGGLATREVVDGGFRPAPGEVVESLSPPAAGKFEAVFSTIYAVMRSQLYAERLGKYMCLCL